MAREERAVKEGRDTRGRFVPGHVAIGRPFEKGASGNPGGKLKLGMGWEQVLAHMKERVAGRTPEGELGKLNLVELGRLAKTLRSLEERGEEKESGREGVELAEEVDAVEDQGTRAALRVIGELEL